MSKNFLTFASIHLGFLISYTLQLVFMNTLLRRFSGGNNIIYLYNLIFFSFIPVGMTLASFSVKKKSFILTIRSSLFLWIGVSIVTLSLIILKQLHHFWILLAFSSSLANGCYWIAYYMALTDYTTADNRDCGLSIIGILTGLANVFIPLLGGYIIKSFNNYTGYIVMFILAFIISILAIFKSHQLMTQDLKYKANKPNISTDNTLDQTPHILFAIKLIIKDKIWLYSSLCEFFRGIRDGVFIFLLNLLIFSVSQNEALVGINAFIAGSLNIAANWALSKLIYRHNKDNKVKLLIISVVTLFISSFLLLIKLDIFTLILMTCINAFFTIFIQNITQSIFCLSVEINEEAKKFRTESFVLKSYFLAFGRLIGILFMTLLPENNLFIVLGMLLLSLLQIGTVITSHKTLKLLNS